VSKNCLIFDLTLIHDDSFKLTRDFDAVVYSNIKTANIIDEVESTHRSVFDEILLM
jgi:hypothetical protein